MTGTTKTIPNDREPSPRKFLPGAGLVFLAAFLWSTGGVSIKFIPADPWLIASVRAAIAGLILLPLLRPRRVRKSWDLVLLLASYALMSGCYVTATKWTAAANAIALQYAAVLWIFFARVAAGSLRPTLRRAAPMVLVAAGIALVLLEPARGQSLAGNLLALLSGLGFALVTVFFRRLKDSHQPTLVCLCNLATAALLAPFILGKIAVLHLPPDGWACLLYLGIFQIALAYVLYARGLARVTALKATTIALIEPVLNPIWVYFLLAEVPTVFAIAGAAVLLSGVLLDLSLNRDQ